MRRFNNLQTVCAAGCYVPYFIQTGGSSVEGTYQTLQAIAFYTEYQSNPALKALVDKLGGRGLFGRRRFFRSGPRTGRSAS